jgi:peptidylprolyl isomerase
MNTDLPNNLDPENTLILTLEWGRAVIQCLPEIAPVHVNQFKAWSREGFFDGLPFHRVIDGFMVQSGDPTGTGEGSAQLTLKGEFSDVSHTRGIVSTARWSHDPNSGSSQFFIMLADAPRLDGQYTVWGKVVEGMEHIDRIKKGDQTKVLIEDGQKIEVSGYVADPNRIVTMRVAADTARLSPQIQM